MHICVETLEIKFNIGPDVADITDELSACVKKSNFAMGMMGVMVIGSKGWPNSKQNKVVQNEPPAVCTLKSQPLWIGIRLLPWEPQSNYDRLASTVKPTSSRSSLSAAFSELSPASMLPPGRAHCPACFFKPAALLVIMMSQSRHRWRYRPRIEFPYRLARPCSGLKPQPLRARHCSSRPDPPGEQRDPATGRWSMLWFS